MARACDVCDGRENVQEVDLVASEDAPRGDPHKPIEGLAEGDTIGKGDLCEPCQRAVEAQGLVGGILRRFALTLTKKRRGTALTELLGDAAGE